MKQLDLNKTVAALVEEYPELIDIMAEIGFKEITKPISLKMMGRVMTIPKGCSVKGFDLNDIITKLNSYGFECVYGSQETVAHEATEHKEVKKDDRTPEGRELLLRDMIERLNKGEDLESVRADFVKAFKDVSVREITGVEQHLIDEGMSVERVQKLCDIHSALFHGRTEQEVMAEEDAQRGINLEMGHPVSQLRLENRIIEKKIEDALKANAEGNREAVFQAITELKGIKPHYAKKEELIMPLLERYGYPGPSQVMWGVDDEIKQELSRISRTINEEKWYEQERSNVEGVLNRMKEMIYKEEEILFPLAMENFTKEDWYHVYEDLEAMGASFVNKTFKWQEAEDFLAAQTASSFTNGMIKMPTGELSINQLNIMLEALPQDITYIDANDHVLYFKDKMHIFPRPKSCIGKLVYDCHPARVRPMVEALLDDFKKKERDHMDIWMKDVRVRYMAVYDHDVYVGCVEMVEDFSEVFKERESK